MAAISDMIERETFCLACRRAHQQPNVKALAMCSPGVELGLCRRQTGSVRREGSKFENVLLGQQVMQPSNMPYMSTAARAYETKAAQIARCMARRGAYEYI